MEARVAKLEASVEHMSADVSAMKDHLSDARERLPWKPKFVTPSSHAFCSSR